MSDKARSRIAKALPYTVVALKRPPSGEEPAALHESYKNIARSVADFQQHTGSNIALLSIACSEIHPDDQEVSRIIEGELLRHGVAPTSVFHADWTLLADGVAFLQQAELVISSRLHGLIMAASAGVAIVGIAHEDKVRGCLEMIGLSPACTFVDEDQPIETLASALRTAWDFRSQYRCGIKNNVEKWASGKKASIDVLSSCLGS